MQISYQRMQICILYPSQPIFFHQIKEKPQMPSGKKLTQRLLPAFFCLLSLLLVACGSNGTGGASSNTTKAPDNKQIFIYAQWGIPDIKTFDPGLTTDQPSAEAINMVFTGLVQLNDKLEVADQLAASHSE